MAEAASGGDQAISDIGTSLMYLWTSAATGINLALGATWNEQLQWATIDCAVANKGPIVRFTDPQGRNYGLQSKRYVLSNGDGTCSTGYQLGGDYLQTCGDMFTRNDYTIYDKNAAFKESHPYDMAAAVPWRQRPRSAAAASAAGTRPTHFLAVRVSPAAALPAFRAHVCTRHAAVSDLLVPEEKVLCGRTPHGPDPKSR
ncbi:hypothetical protein HK405_014125, partial [Cladochytrium tenue]